MVGVGEPDVAALRASLADQRAGGVQTEEIGRAEVARLWPAAELADFAAFVWDARGGYGGAYRTAQAYAAAVRRAGARVRQGTAVSALPTAGERVTGVRPAAHGTELPITVRR